MIRRPAAKDHFFRQINYAPLYRIQSGVMIAQAFLSYLLSIPVPPENTTPHEFR